ncbi:hypothetical protein QN224_13020 [Sinorhizobium sp. 8-89]|uniref:hypothetical protein n=1 Tax=Sinorhizobium sp. 7-81 TaxID=3049087 RepID=UPI0024C2C8C7|nr:hypothetical protein [Sinorhizobium sp. 7-81]MDK1386330.1 hypothetical protein [Sinorhizobium sp. 7-81]
MKVSAKPFCDMSIDELEAEHTRLDAQIRRAPAWSAHLAAMDVFRSDCKHWLHRRRAEAQEEAHG